LSYIRADAIALRLLKSSPVREILFIEFVRMTVPSNIIYTYVLQQSAVRLLLLFILIMADEARSGTSLPDPLEDVTDVLPDYHEAAAPRYITHVYTLGTTSKPWLTFELKSRANKAEDLPYFFGHVPITGRIVLDLVKPEYIQSIEIEVRKSPDFRIPEGSLDTE
jgi:hypothetical protein